MAQTVEIGDAAVYLQRLRLPVGLLVDEFTARGEGIRIATEPFSVLLNAPGTFQAVIHENALTEFVSRRLPGQIETLNLQLKEGKIFAEASVRVLIPVRGNATLALEIHDGQELHLRMLEASIAQGLIENQMAQLNPVFSMKQLPVAGKLTEVVIEEGRLVIKGEALPA